MCAIILPVVNFVGACGLFYNPAQGTLLLLRGSFTPFQSLDRCYVWQLVYSRRYGYRFFIGHLNDWLLCRNPSLCLE